MYNVRLVILLKPKLTRTHVLKTPSLQEFLTTVFPLAIFRRFFFCLSCPNIVVIVVVFTVIWFHSWLIQGPSWEKVDGCGREMTRFFPLSVFHDQICKPMKIFKVDQIQTLLIAQRMILIQANYTEHFHVNLLHSVC